MRNDQDLTVVEDEATEAFEEATPAAEDTDDFAEIDEAVDDAATEFAATEFTATEFTADPLGEAIEVMERLRRRLRAQVLGRDEVIDLVLVALLSDGHVLLEDFPGSGKTTLAKALGNSIVDDRSDDYIASFRRIQFTPDLLPSDVTGVSVFDAASNRFRFRHGPIFAHVVLADEINRTSPKVQSAMLEAMAEKQVTVDNVTYPLDELFFVIATQNPLDLAGTYPLPVAQLDRFLFKIRMEHIDRASELEVLNTYRERRDTERRDLPRVTRTQVLEARRAVDERVAIDDQVKECLVDIARTVRADERVLQGSSTRSLVLILPALQALAALRGRDYVSSDDIQTLVPRVLGHRIELAPGVGEMQVVIDEAMEQSIEGLARSTLRRR
jgi:MoxR-like ATPase